MIYVEFGRILVPSNNRQQTPDESYSNKYQNYIGCSFSYKLVCADNQLKKPFNSYLGQVAVHKFISNIVVA